MLMDDDDDDVDVIITDDKNKDRDYEPPLDDDDDDNYPICNNGLLRAEIFPASFEGWRQIRHDQVNDIIL